jgi:integrase/recombinase XerD
MIDNEDSDYWLRVRSFVAPFAVQKEFLEQLDVSEKTRSTYRRALRQWEAYLEEHQLTIATANRYTVLGYKKHLQAEGKKPATVNAYLTAVRRLYAWTEANGNKPNIAASIKGLKKAATTAKDALTIDQAKALLADVPGEEATLEELRNHAIVTLCILRGLRTIEVARADIGDVRTINGQAVLYVQGKGYSDKSAFVILNRTCLEPINRYLEARQESDLEAPLFAGIGNKNQGGRLTTRTVSRIIKAAFAKHGINSARLTAHSTRHTAATMALLAGADLQETRDMLRHSSINTTMIYAHNIKRMEAGAEHAIDRLLLGA